MRPPAAAVAPTAGPTVEPASGSAPWSADVHVEGLPGGDGKGDGGHGAEAACAPTAPYGAPAAPPAPVATTEMEDTPCGTVNVCWPPV